MLIPVFITLIPVSRSTLWPPYHWITNCFAFIAIINHFYNTISSCLYPLLFPTDYSKDNRTCTFQSGNEIAVAKRPVNTHILRTFIIILWATLCLSPVAHIQLLQCGTIPVTAVREYHGWHHPRSPLSTGYRVEFSRCIDSYTEVGASRFKIPMNTYYRDHFKPCYIIRACYQDPYCKSRYELRNVAWHNFLRGLDTFTAAQVGRRFGVLDLCGLIK
jgi:hypothetical protein